jgi:GPH family glycoside/pentoside/hexuronide:cation symporter
MIWWSPPLQGQLAKAIYYGAAYTLYYTINTIIALPYYSLTPELTSDYDERTSLTTFRMIFSLIGTGSGIFIGMSTDWSPGNEGIIVLLGIIMGIGAAIPFFLVFFGTRENPDYQVLPRPKLMAEINAALTNKPFLYSAGIILFSFLALETIQQMLLFYLKYYLRIESATEAVSASLIAAALISLPFWNMLSEKLNKIKAYIAGTSFMALALVSLFFIPPGAGVPLVCAFAALTGIGFGAIQVLSWAIIPDTIEYDEFESGERHEGMFYSLVTLFRKISTAFILPATGFILGATGYVANSMTQNPGTITAIRFMMALAPAAVLILGILLALKYPITREAFHELSRKLEQRKLEDRKPEVNHHADSDS